MDKQIVNGLSLQQAIEIGNEWNGLLKAHPEMPQELANDLFQYSQWHEPHCMKKALPEFTAALNAGQWEEVRTLMSKYARSCSC